jgi:predicted GIY-YIG superfamily endonuclease
VSWYCYLLVSSDSRRTYVGISRDPRRRLEEHNGIRKGGAKTTRGSRPWRLDTIYGPFESRGEAQRFEAKLKKDKSERRARREILVP